MTAPAPLHLISSMATRALLADLARGWDAQHPEAPLKLEAVGGVDAAKRVAAGEAFDIVALAANAIDKLIAEGHVLPGSRVDLVHSGVAVAVRAGAAQPDISSEDALKQAVRAARTVGYSTGPSGTALLKLFERWGIAAELEGRLVQAPAGIPVGRQVADGQVELGFQQLSELISAPRPAVPAAPHGGSSRVAEPHRLESLPGITVVGPLPDAVQITTTFSGGVARTSQRPDTVRALLAFMADRAHDELKRRHGMEPA